MPVFMQVALPRQYYSSKKEMLSLQTLRVMGIAKEVSSHTPATVFCSCTVCMYVPDTHRDSFTSFQRVQSATSLGFMTNGM